ncbi:hypothetical protein M3T53_01595 [Actinomyces sp. B33]|nr:hypothetical protein [Actinomyces sp. B33]
MVHLHAWHSLLLTWIEENLAGRERPFSSARRPRPSGWDLGPVPWQCARTGVDTAPTTRRRHDRLHASRPALRLRRSGAPHLGAHHGAASRQAPRGLRRRREHRAGEARGRPGFR